MAECKECDADDGQPCAPWCQAGADIFESRQRAAGVPGYGPDDWFCEACQHPIPGYQTQAEHAAVCDAQ